MFLNKTAISGKTIHLFYFSTNSKSRCSFCCESELIQLIILTEIFSDHSQFEIIMDGGGGSLHFQ